MAERVGQRLGNYTLLRLLGEGGFAEVYLGEHFYLKSQAAIKVLQTRLSSTDDTDSFLREAQTIARLTHPNIIRVLDFGIEHEVPYLVMDFAPNGTVRQLYPKGTKVPLLTAASYVKQVADALQYAHDEHIIHRDVKPENMLLGRRNEVLLSDFGIALISQTSRSQGTQDVIGTVAYMSPEQIQGKPRPASDQYSLGIVTYEWLTGERPFHGSFTELCTQHMFASPPPLQEKLSGVSSAIENVLLKALHKEPQQRFATIGLFAEAFEEAIQQTAKDAQTVLMLPSSAQPLQSLQSPQPPASTGTTSGSNNTFATRAQTGNSPSSPASFSQSQQDQQGQQRSQAAQAMLNGNESEQAIENQQIGGMANGGLPTFHSSETVAQTAPSHGAVQGQGQQFQQHAQAQPAQQSITPHQAPHTPFSQSNSGWQQQPQAGQQNVPPHYNAANQAHRSPTEQQPPFRQAQYGQPQQSAQMQQAPAYPDKPRFQSQPARRSYQEQEFEQRSRQHTPSPRPHGERDYDERAELARSSARPDHIERPERRNQERNESSEELFGFLGEWKWQFIQVIAGIILLCVFYNFRPYVYGHSVLAVLVVPLFFSGAFGPWVGLCIALGGFAVSDLLYGIDVVHGSLLNLLSADYDSWIPWLIFAVAGFVPGLASLFKRKHMPTLSSSVRGCILTILGFAISIGFILYRHGLLKLFPQIGLVALFTILVSFALVLVYGLVANLVNPS